jgi:hypothetical protein
MSGRVLSHVRSLAGSHQLLATWHGERTPPFAHGRCCQTNAFHTACEDHDDDPIGPWQMIIALMICSIEYENGGATTTLVFGMRANARPARRAGPIVRPPRFRPEWADEGGPSTGARSIGRTPT